MKTEKSLEFFQKKYEESQKYFDENKELNQ